MAHRGEALRPPQGEFEQGSVLGNGDRRRGHRAYGEGHEGPRDVEGVVDERVEVVIHDEAGRVAGQLLIEPATRLNFVDALLPRSVTAPMHTTAMSATSNAY